MASQRASLGPGAYRYGAAIFANALGTGFFYTFALIFYSTLADLDLSVVGRVLTLTALVALPGLFVVGRLVDKFGPRPVLLVAVTARGIAFLVFVATPSLSVLTGCTLLLALGSRAEQAAGPLLAARAATEQARSRWLALSRVAFNAGVGSGAVLAGVMATGGDDGFRLLGALTGFACLASAVLYGTVPQPRLTSLSLQPRQAVRLWQHRDFSRVALANAVLWMAAFAMETALPIFVVVSLGLPTVMVGALFALNTAMLVIAQLPASRVLERWQAGRSLAVGGLLYLVFYGAATVAGVIPPMAAGILLVVGLVGYTLGELAVTQSSLVLLTSLPPPGQQGSFLAQNQILVGLFTAFSPLVATTLLAAGVVWLWAGLSVVSVIAAVLAWPVNRPEDVEACEPVAQSS